MSDILSKIQKLLALGSSPNEHEAKAAMAKAQALMDEHNISMSQVEGYESSSTGFVNADVETLNSMTPPYDMTHVASILVGHFFVRAYYSKEIVNGKRVRILRFFGQPENVKVAIHVFVYLRRTFRSLWAQYRKRYGADRKESNSYYSGLVYGFTQKLRRERMARESRSSKNALVVVNSKLDEAYMNQYGDEKPKDYKSKSKSRSVLAYYGGCKDGGRINLHQSLESGPETGGEGNEGRTDRQRDRG